MAGWWPAVAGYRGADGLNVRPPFARSRQDDYRLRNTQQAVDEVVGIMRNNVEKVLERDQKLGDLEDKSGTTRAASPRGAAGIAANMCGVFVCVRAWVADALRDGAARFETTSRKLKRKMWCKNIKVGGRARPGLRG